MTSNKIFLTGCIGISGALLMFIGDMLMYFNTNEISNLNDGIKLALSQVSSLRLILGGAVAPIAGLMYFIGFYHVYFAIAPFYPKIGKLVIFLLCVGFMYGIVYHTHFVPLGFGLRYSERLASLLEENLNIYIYISVICMSISNIILLVLVIAKKTLYPLWIILCLPITLILIGNVLNYLPQPFLMVFAGGWNNLLFVIFFSISTWILAKKNNSSNLA